MTKKHEVFDRTTRPNKRHAISILKWFIGWLITVCYFIGWLIDLTANHYNLVYHKPYLCNSNRTEPKNLIDNRVMY